MHKGPQAKDLKIGIIGGSIAGLSAAFLLQKLGATVTILERSSRPLVGRGAGIVMPNALIQKCIEFNLFDASLPHIPLKDRSFRVKAAEDLQEGKAIWAQPLPQASAVNWNKIHATLRQRIPAEIYHSTEEIVHISQTSDQVEVMSTKGDRYQFDYLIAADGISSQVRQAIFPELAPTYAHYVAWRGTVSLGPELRTFAEDHVPYYVYDKGHLLCYCIPDLQAGHTLLNWVWYDISPWPLEKLLQDKDGKRHPVSLPPGSLSQEHLQYMQSVAKSVFPAAIAEKICQTPQPFLQAVFDFHIPQYVKDRICFIGDAATVLRPHSASGLVKAMQDSMSLASAFGTTEDLPTALAKWNESQLATSQQQLILARSMGEALVTQPPEWEKMTPTLLDTWWKQVMTGKNWYATQPTPPKETALGSAAEKSVTPHYQLSFSEPVLSQPDALAASVQDKSKLKNH